MLVDLYDGVPLGSSSGEAELSPSIPSSAAVQGAAASVPLLEFFLNGSYANTGSLGGAADMSPLAPDPGVFTASTRDEKKLAAAACVPGVGRFAGGRTPDLAALHLPGPCSLFLCVQGAVSSTLWGNSQTFTLAHLGRSFLPERIDFGVFFYGPTSTFVFYHNGLIHEVADSGRLLQAGQRYNLFCTRSAEMGGSQTVRLYVGGQLAASVSCPAQASSPGSNFFDLGNAYGYHNLAQAVFDYAALWDSELTPTQVAAVNALFPIR